jgi:hypothetical protein
MPAGKVVNSETGMALPGVTVWQMSADGTSANILGYTDSGGSFSVQPDPGYNLMFSQDGYDAANVPGLTGSANTVQLDPEGAVTVTIKKSSWVLIVGALLGLYLMNTKGKR